MTVATAVTTTSITASAGSRRLARRVQKPARSRRPVRSYLATSRSVIRNPLSTKKMSTPRKPPGSPEAPSWKPMTVRTASARTPSRPGARSRGRNTSDRVSWSRTCTITSWEPARELVYQTRGGAALGDSTEWRFTLDAADVGTTITQSFRVLGARPWADRVILALVPAHHDRLPALRDDLARL